MPANTVWLRDQNMLIPNDLGLYIVVGIVSAIPMHNSVYMQAETVNAVTTQHQISQVIMQENVQIDVLSRSNDAMNRAWEVIAALQSFYSQQQQEVNTFKIFRLPRSFTNTSYAEGGSQLNRYTLSVQCHAWYNKDTVMNSPLGDYYVDFHQQVDDDLTIGTSTPVAKFEINNGVIS